MAEARQLAEAVRAGDVAEVGESLRAGADIAARDDDDWSALDWAAGKGDESIIALLLEHGADPLAAGRDLRRPHDIALAAGHLRAARMLRDAADRADPDPQDHGWRPYCRAYPLADLRRYPGWSAADPDASDAPADDGADDQIVYLHHDLTVTSSIWPGEDVLFADATADWARFCASELGFRVPDELDLVPPETG